MDDFSIPGKKNAYGVEPSESNMIQPRKRPQSSTAPSIFLDKDGIARLVIGASGGTKITTAISLVRSSVSSSRQITFCIRRVLKDGRFIPDTVVQLDVEN